MHERVPQGVAKTTTYYTTRIWRGAPYKSWSPSTMCIKHGRQSDVSDWGSELARAGDLTSRRRPG
eukprot:5180639-Pleurochrysis_carterae.AAC.1